MCGIAGCIIHQPVVEDRIQSCLRSMKHRGPDYQSYYHYTTSNQKHIYLFHARLNIIDLDVRSNQPFKTGSNVMVYNGELYNYLELKQKLVADGVVFNTTSDTEVLLHWLRVYGIDGLDQAEGMWSFAWFDAAREQLYLSRDRFGEKPLYLYQDESGLYFASEPKAIMAMLGKTLKPNMNHLYRYLVNGYKTMFMHEDTFFEGLQRLPASFYVRINTEFTKEYKRYWRPGFLPDESMTYDQAVAGVRDRMIESVKLRLRADVPLAFCMSGGIDSNALISIAKNVFDYDVHGFTIVNTDQRYDENEMVEHAVSTQNLRHTAIPVQTGNFLPNLRKLVRHHDSPVSTISYYAHWLLMQGVSEAGYRISVSGTAADELFTGYYDHHLFYMAEIHHNHSLYETARTNWENHVKPVVRNPFLQNPLVFVEQPNFRGHINLNADEFSTWLVNEWHEEFQDQKFLLPVLRNRMWNELFHETVPPLLHEDDLNAMYYSIENRSPYLDRPLFEFANTIPTRHLIQDAKAKSVLRDAMKGIAPDVIMQNRRKVGFNAPIFSFLDVQDESVKQEILADSPIFSHVRREKIEALNQQDELPNSASKFLFFFLTTKLFLEEFS